MLSEPASKVLAKFGLKPDPAIEDAIALIVAVGAVYGPRAIVIMDRHKREGATNITPKQPAFSPRPQPTQARPAPVAPSTVIDASALFVDPGLIPPIGE